jgi:uncharacterized protein YciI
MLFLVDLTYKAPMGAIQAVLEPHMAFVARCFDGGHFLASGRKDPRTGGIIIAKAEDEGALRALLAEDPFLTEDLVTLSVQAFHPSRVSPAFAEAFV